MARRRRCARGPSPTWWSRCSGWPCSRSRESCSRATRSPIARRRSRASSRSCPTAQAEADRTKSFADFAALQLSREQTVASLAQSRFDWERVLRELAIVIPHDVWLTSLNASVSQDAATSSASSSSSSGSSAGSESITGPSLQIEGCAGGHEAVARFLAALGDVDGVTRVSVLKSDRPDLASSGEAATAASSGTAAGSEGCSSRDFVSQFEVVAAFDAVQIDAGRPRGLRQRRLTTPTRDFDHDRPPTRARSPMPGSSFSSRRTRPRRRPRRAARPWTRSSPGPGRRHEAEGAHHIALVGHHRADRGGLAGRPGAEARPGGEPQAGRRPASVAARAGPAGGRSGSAGAEVVPGRLPEAGGAGQGGAAGRRPGEPPGPAAAARRPLRSGVPIDRPGGRRRLGDHPRPGARHDDESHELNVNQLHRDRGHVHHFDPHLDHGCQLDGVHRGRADGAHPRPPPRPPPRRFQSAPRSARRGWG